MAKVLRLNYNLEFEEIEIEIKGVYISVDILDSLIEGYFEVVRYNKKLNDNRILMLVDEEGKLKDLSPTIAVVDFNNGNKILEMIAGKVLFVSFDDNEDMFCLSERQIELIKDVIKYKATIRSLDKNEEIIEDIVRVLPYK